MVGMVKKSMAAIWPMWFVRKVRQFCEGGFGWRAMSGHYIRHLKESAAKSFEGIACAL